jgi:hypothetical protein
MPFGNRVAVADTIGNLHGFKLLLPSGLCGPLSLIFLWVLLGQLDLFFKGATRLDINDTL